MRERSLPQSSQPDSAQAPTPAWLLAFAAALSLLASACCVLPLLLVALGLSAAWLVPMHSLTKYWPIFIVGAIAMLIAAKRRIACESAPCDSKNARSHTLVFWAIVTWTGVAVLVPLVAPLFY